jgi:hypothetical protein
MTKSLKKVRIKSIDLWRWHINISTTILDINNRSFFYLKNTTFRRLDFVSIFRWNLLLVSFYWPIWVVST